MAAAVASAGDWRIIGVAARNLMCNGGVAIVASQLYQPSVNGA